MNEQYRNAIGSVESSNDYSALGPFVGNDRAYGRYQVMGANIPEWTQRHLGQAMTPEQFLASPEAQDKVFDGQTAAYYKKHGNLDDVTSSWFSGRPLAQAGNASDGYNTVPEYIAKVNKAYGAPDGVSAINTAAGITPSTPGALTSAFAAKDDNAGALSPSNTLGSGVLFNGDRDEINKLSALGSGLTGIGAALAGISSPEQSKALTQQQLAMQKVASDKSWTVGHVDPKTGMAIASRKDGKVVTFKAFQPKPDANPYDEAFDKESAKQNVDLDSKISQGAQDAVSMQGTIGELRKALSNPDLTQGLGGELSQTLRKGLSYFDPELAKTAADGDVANALAKQMALRMVNPPGGSKLLPGSFSDSDRQFVERMGPGLNNTPDANDRLLAIIEKGTRRAMEAEQARIAYTGDPAHSRLDNGFRAVQMQLQEKWRKEDADSARTTTSIPAAPKTMTLPKGVKSIQIIQ